MTPSVSARRPLAALRRRILLDLYATNGVVTLQEARELLPVNDATIRRDLVWLARATGAERVYGGVVRPGGRDPEASVPRPR